MYDYLKSKGYNCIDLGPYNNKSVDYVDYAYQLGNIINSSIEDELKKQVEVEPKDDDMQYLDAYNHLILKYIHDYTK